MGRSRRWNRSLSTCDRVRSWGCWARTEPERARSSAPLQDSSHPMGESWRSRASTCGTSRGWPSSAWGMRRRSPRSMKSCPQTSTLRSSRWCALWIPRPRATARTGCSTDSDSPAASTSPSINSLMACARNCRSSRPCCIVRACCSVTRRSMASTRPAPSPPRTSSARWPAPAPPCCSRATSPRPSSACAIAPSCSTSGPSRVFFRAPHGATPHPAPRRSSANSSTSREWRMRNPVRVMAAVALMVGSWLATRPAAAASPIDSLLWAASAPAQVRSTLIAFATAARETSTANRGEAWYYAGMSYEHSGSADSALLCYEKAVSIRGSSPERDAYVDALLSRGEVEDGERALEVLGPRLKVALFNAETDIALTRGRWAWARYIEGHADSALTGLRLQQRWLLDLMTPRRRDWQYRLGLVELEQGDAAKCVELMVPLAVASRFQDRDVMGI